MAVTSESGNTSIGLGDRILEYTVHPRENVYALKTLAYYDVGWAPRHQRLVFMREELPDEMTIEEVGLKDLDTIALVRLEAGEANPLLTAKDVTEVCQPCQTCNIS